MCMDASQVFADIKIQRLRITDYINSRASIKYTNRALVMVWQPVWSHVSWKVQSNLTCTLTDSAQVSCNKKINKKIPLHLTV